VSTSPGSGSSVGSGSYYMYLYSGSHYVGEVTLSGTGHEDLGVFSHFFNINLTNAISMTWSDSDSGHMYGLCTQNGAGIKLVFTHLT
jgi:hypothetical protein